MSTFLDDSGFTASLKAHSPGSPTGRHRMHKIATTPLPSQRSFITYRLLRTHSALNTQAIKLLRSNGNQTITQWRVMSMLVDRQGATAAELCRDTGIDKGQLSRTLKQLLDDALVSQRQNADDQRQVIVSLTTAGRRLHAETLPAMRARQQHLEAHLDPGEKEQLFAILDKLDRAVENAKHHA